MRLGYIARTEHAKLNLSVEAPLSQEEWDELSAALSAWEPAVVSQGAQTVTRLLEGLQEASDGGVKLADPVPGNVHVFTGPLDASVMGLNLHRGDVARMTESHESVHVGAMHKWAKESSAPVRYVCGHGGCTAHVTLTPGL